MTSSTFPTDLTSFLDEYVNKKGNLKRKDINQFEAAGGNLKELRDLYESGDAEFNLKNRAQDMLRNKTASMDNVEILNTTDGRGAVDIPSFMKEFASPRGKVTKSDMKAFEQAGGDLAKLQTELQKGNYTREEALSSPIMLNDRGTAIKYGNEDTYIGGAGQRFLEKRLADLSNTETAFPDETDNDEPGTTTPGTELSEEVVTTPGNETVSPETPVTNPNPTTGTPDIDPGSGFPFNPGSQPGLESIGNLKENIAAIQDRTDERIDAITEGKRVSPEDTLTYSYTQDLINSGVLPGTPGFKSAEEKDAERLAGDLAIKDAFDPEFMEQRSDQRMSELEALQDLNKERRNQRSDEIWGEDGSYQAMMELRAANRTPLPSILDFIPRVQELQKPPEGGTKPDKSKKNTYKNLPDLLSQPTGGRIEGPDLYTSGGDIPKFKKKPSFDGYKGPEGFQTWLGKVTNEEELAEGMHQGKAKLYNMLTDAGLSADDIYRGTQAAGISNLNRVDEAEQVIKAFENNFYEGDDYGKSLKTEEDLFNWYKDQGGENLTLDDAIAKAGFKSYDSESDANKLVKILTKDLKKSGITAEPNKKDLKKFNRQMDDLEERFGGKLKFKSYKEALENQGADTVNEWVKQYINLGGGVGRKVNDALAPQTYFSATNEQDLIGPLPLEQNLMGPLTPLQTVFPTTSQQPMGPLQYSFNY